MQIDINKVLEEIKILPKFSSQIGIQGTDDNLDPFRGCGYYVDLAPYKEKDFNVPIFDMPYTNSIIRDLKMFRTRLMRLKSKECYTYHWDHKKRLHVPLITNEKCFFIVDKELLQLPADGKSYVVDTTKMHTAINASWEDRLHLVGVIDE